MDGKRENYQVSSVQYCVPQLCTVQCNQCHYSNFSGFLQKKTTKNISFHNVVPGILVCVLCPRNTFAHATLICTFLTN